MMWTRRQLWQLTWELARTDFKLRYHGTKVGYAWAVLKPFLTFLIINFVFSNVFSRVEFYTVQLLTGIIFWTFFAEGTRIGLTALVSNRSLLKRIPVPHSVLIISSLIPVAFTTIINLFILIGFLVYYHVPVTIGGIGTTIVLFFVTIGLTVGASFITAPLHVRYRDISQLWDLFLRIGFYMAPIMYPLQVLPEAYQRWLWINPMSYVIHTAKEALILHHLPSPSHLVLVSLLTIAGVLTSWLVFRIATYNITDHL